MKDEKLNRKWCRMLRCLQVLHDIYMHLSFFKAHFRLFYRYCDFLRADQIQIFAKEPLGTDGSTDESLASPGYDL